MKQKILLIIFYSVCAGLFAQKPSYQIGILMDVQNEKTNTFLNQLKNQIKLVVGEDARLIFSPEHLLSNDYNLQKAKQNYEQLERSSLDLIIAIGSVNYAAINTFAETVKPTIVFSDISKEVANVDVSQDKTNISNLCYLIEQKSFNSDLQQFQEIANFKRLGILVEPAVMQAFPLKTIFEPLLQPLNASAQFIPLTPAKDLGQSLDSIDAVYLIGGSFMSDQKVKELAELLLDKQLPSFTINGIEQVRNGWMATHETEDQTDLIIRRLALTVEQFVNGVELAEMPIWLSHRSQLTLNYNTSEAVGIPLKMNFIEKMDFVSGNRMANKSDQYSLKEVILQALENNLSLKAAQQNIALQDQEVNLAKTDYLPQLNAALNTTHTEADFAALGFGLTPEFQTTGNLAVEQIIFSKKINTNIEIQKTLGRVEAANFNAEQLNLISESINKYFNVLMAKTNLELQLRNLEVTKKNYQIAEQNFEAGLFGKRDALRFKSEIAQNTQAMVEAGNQLDQELNNLNNLLNNSLRQKIDVKHLILDDESLKSYQYNDLFEWLDDPNTREKFIAFVTDEARSNAPELKALRQQLEAINKAIDLSDKGRFFPTIAFQGQFNTVFDRSGSGSTAFEGAPLPNNYYQVGLNVSLPIFNRNQNNLRKQKSRIQQSQLLIVEEQTKMDMDLTARNTVLNLINRIANLELSAVSEDAASEALQMTQTAYSSGAVNSAQLIDAQNNLLNAQLQKATAVYAYLLTASQIERLIGHFFLLHSDEENQQFKQKMITQF